MVLNDKWPWKKRFSPTNYNFLLNRLRPASVTLQNRGQHSESVSRKPPKCPEMFLKISWDSLHPKMDGFMKEPIWKVKCSAPKISETDDFMKPTF